MVAADKEYDHGQEESYFFFCGWKQLEYDSIQAQL